jgi:hypothetical protein
MDARISPRMTFERLFQPNGNTLKRARLAARAAKELGCDRPR